MHPGNGTAGAWSPDGREIAVAGKDGTVWMWNVAPMAEPIETLQRQAEVLSAHRIEPKLGPVALTTAELRARWEAMKLAH